MNGRPGPETRLGDMAALAAAILWGTSWVAVALALADISPLAVSFVRGVAQAAILGGVLVALGLRYAEFAWATHPWRLNRQQLTVLVGLGSLGGLFMVTQAFAVELAGTSVAALVGTQYPLVAAVLAPSLLGERLTRRRFGALGLTSIGVLILGAPLLAEPTRLAGLIVATLAAFTFGLYLVASRRLMPRFEVPALAPTLAVFVGAAALSLPALSGSVQPFGVIGIATFAAVGWLVVGAGILPLALVEYAVRTMPAVRVSPYLFVTPIVAAGLGMVLLGDHLLVVQLAGAALAVVGIGLATTDRDPVPGVVPKAALSR